MLKLPGIILVVCFLVVVFGRGSLAAGLSLTSIGTLATGGASYNHWWYTVTNPTLTGTASPSASITTTIDSSPSTATANSSGVWSQPTSTLTNGDHTISITNGTSTIAFTLTIGSTMPAQSTGSGTPATATSTPILILTLLSLGAVVVGYRTLKLS